ncbi:hypothetical protein [Endozoicomonas sp. 8E]|uniref:hypothetical protein n=1 Tax=Endozoicomonas sp. 8E TaxID=3035692 RepID=UPI002938F021|nr:hypothetical protein [Endozoicomonas sp. 8E]WOG27643.1 hypothetical protein P6910_24355 [Endozoicomonas sp. 8E]
MELARKLELHYYFNDESHSMDAFVRNKCETEILAVIKEVAETLEIKIRVESEAHKEGGLRDIWKFTGDNNAQIALVVSVVALILSQVPKTDSETEKLQKELLQLSIQEKKLQIEKLKKEIKENELSDNAVEAAKKITNKSYKVIARKSNFYKKLSHYDKVSNLGVSSLDHDGLNVGCQEIIPKSKFKRFILASNNLPTHTDENASVEIIAPVLKESNAHWKGLYKDEPISFSMQDKEFKEAVLNKSVSFQHGSTIVCVLKIRRKLDEAGEITVTGHAVDTVLEKIEKGVSKETTQGRQYRYARKMQDSQHELSLEPEEST